MICPDCEKFTGRNKDKCLGVGMEGRKDPPLYVIEDFRQRHGILCDNVPPARSDHKARGGSVKISGNAEKQAERPWDVTQPSRGLGDVVAKITHATGIDKLVKAATGKKGCGCAKRQAALNAAVPFKG
jgi:hypothetical protein